jgi:hypothetical protein
MGSATVMSSGSLSRSGPSGQGYSILATASKELRLGTHSVHELCCREESITTDFPLSGHLWPPCVVLPGG